MYCGGALTTSHSSDEEIDCSSCKTSMIKNTILGVTIDECPSCLSRWFDRGELKELISKKAELAVRNPVLDNHDSEGAKRFVMTQTKIEYRACPRCKEPMQRRNYERISGIMIDSCPHHGVFLDGGEFDRLRAFVKTGGVEEAKAVRKEEKEWQRRQQAVIDKIDACRGRMDRPRGGLLYPSASEEWEGDSSFWRGLGFLEDLADLFLDD